MKSHILFVDDEPPMRELLSLYFRKRGYEVSTATRSSEVWPLIENRSFDVAILDVDIAGENGLELLTAMKNKHPKLPIIMFTGLNADGGLLDKAVALGASGLMRKTDPLHELFAAVQKFAPLPVA